MKIKHDFEVGQVGVVPPRYATASGITPFHVFDAYELNPYEAYVFKYLVRWPYKGGLTDLKKAKHTVQEARMRFDEDRRLVDFPETTIVEIVTAFRPTKWTGLAITTLLMSRLEFGTARMLEQCETYIDNEILEEEHVQRQAEANG